MKKLLLTLALCALALSGCKSVERKTPLGWCLSEIRHTQGYEELLFWTSTEVPQEELYKSKYTTHAYVIKTYTDDVVSEWACGIAVKNDLFRYIKASDIVEIDCDIIYEINLVDGKIE